MGMQTGISRMASSSSTDDKAKLQKVIDSHDLVIFSAPVGPKHDKTCPYVRKTLKTLTDAGITFHHHVVGPKGTDTRNALISLCHGTKTVPEGFCLGKYIGGFDGSDAGHLGFPGIMPLFKDG